MMLDVSISKGLLTKTTSSFGSILAMSNIYKDELPESCPPADALDAKDVIFYRLVDNPISSQDFLSNKALNPLVDFKNKECEARSVSVFINLQGAIELLKSPVYRDTKHIAKVSVSEISGKHKRTFQRNHHHSWWIYDDFDPLQCSTILPKEAAS